MHRVRGEIQIYILVQKSMQDVGSWIVAGLNLLLLQAFLACWPKGAWATVHNLWKAESCLSLVPYLDPLSCSKCSMKARDDAHPFATFKSVWKTSQWNIKAKLAFPYFCHVQNLTKWLQVQFKNRKAGWKSKKAAEKALAFKMAASFSFLSLVIPATWKAELKTGIASKTSNTPPRTGSWWKLILTSYQGQPKRVGTCAWNIVRKQVVYALFTRALDCILKSELTSTLYAKWSDKWTKKNVVSHVHI